MAAPAVSSLMDTRREQMFPLLDDSDLRGWYWIEVFRYSTAALIQEGTQGLVTPDPGQPYLYRINALARGLRAGTRVHLRSVFIPRPAP